MIPSWGGLDLAISIRQALQHKELMSKSRQLLKITRQQTNLLKELEKNHPGITNLKQQADSTIPVEESIEDFNTLMQKIDQEINRSKEFKAELQVLAK